MTHQQFFAAVKTYIEDKEEQIEGEWGSGRSVAHLIEIGAMPELYSQVLLLICDHRQTVGAGIGGRVCIKCKERV